METRPKRCTIKMDDHGCIEDTPDDPDGPWIFDPWHFIDIEDYRHVGDVGEREGDGG